nr:ribonuclease H-like domain-containing protein [Tanacetum cinerariifolium]
MQTQTSNILHNAIMEADSKDRPPMLAPGNYVQWKSRIKRYIDTKPNHKLIHYCLENPSYKLHWKDTEVPIFEGSPITTTERIHETYKNVSQEIRDQLNAEAEAVQIILTGIDNDIYSIVDACPNACEMWKSIERLKQGESINVEDLETNLYWEFGKFTSQDGESLESYYSRSQQAATKNREKAIVNSSQPIYDQEPSMVAEDDKTSKDKEIDKHMALISLSNVGYENQRIGNVARAREIVGSSVVQKFRIQCYNYKEFGHVAKECQKSKRAKDAAYHREKMLLYQELEAHYMYMAQVQEVSPDAADFGPIFDDEPLQKIVIIDSLDMIYDREEIDQNDDDDNDLATEQKIANRTYIGYIDPLIQSTIESNFSPVINRINARLDQFHRCLNEEMVADLRYFNSLEFEVDSLRSQLETQKIQFLNEIDRLSREYYYADHMNAILGVYTELDEVTNLQCDYLELLEKCEGPESELSKSKMMSKRFESVQKHAINLELELQQCKEKIKNDKLFKVIQTKDFCKERKHYFEIQDLKAQLQDKGIVISELKKLIEKWKEKSVDTKFEKSSVIRQPNAFKSQRPSVLGKPTTFSNSFVRNDFLKSKSVTQTNVSNDF